MSKRHERLGLPLTDPELRAQARAERQRVRSALAVGRGSLAAESDIEALDDFGVQYRAPHRHDPERARAEAVRKPTRHWKQPFWKRRSLVRSQRARVASTLA
jgi:hypothetical protein